MLARLRTPLMAVAVSLASVSLAAPPPTAPVAPAEIDWKLSPERIASSCKAELQKARARVKALVPPRAEEAPAAEALVSVETAIADMHDALVAQKLLASVSSDKAVREASAKCNDDVSAFTVEVSASPTVYALAQAAQARATTPADKQLATVYREAGRRVGAHLDAAARAEVTRWFDRLTTLQSEYMQALISDQATVTLSKAEAASLPAAFVATLKARGNGYVVPVGLSSYERFMRSTASGAARKRYLQAYFHIGGAANAKRVREAVALRDRIARKLGFDSWAAYQLDTRMAKTPERALALLRDVDARLLPKARAELAALAALKAEQGDATPFAAWDYPYYQEQLEQTRHAIDTEALRQYFPIDKVVPAVLDIYQHLLGVRFEAIEPAEAWAPGVLRYAMSDSASGAPIGHFYLDLAPRSGKFMRPASFTSRLGRQLPSGDYRSSISSIIGNGPASEPGKPSLFSHRDAIEFFHEFGHLMHAMLSTAPYASLHGANVRGDFVEAPSQMLENWMWQPSILKKVSSHVETGQPLPDALIEKLIARKHAADGLFWTRQVFLAMYDMTLHGSGPKRDANRLWFELMPPLTPLPPPPTNTLPEASFLPIMGGYDAGYYGYVWSRVYAQDMFTAFQKGGLESPEVGQRYRREVLAPGATQEPAALLENFLGRPVRYDAFYEELGITP
ncbi:M3 family metallopeptidase [Hyalangium rubrum]|uniref:M3 family metallopeptidase n=1 Tax=Hyalangium rubrum TaxID=3103134 RepID=A0ABU5H2X1_9BACT|nr:M3 family metallopeptidase [Hyalangium sp. s54d21]MDY7226450.1 M3 family metallopeptidase [Hyalangium sp. s54d21]